MIVVQVKTLDGRGTQTRAIFNDVETLLNLRFAAIEESPASGAAVETGYLFRIPKTEAAMKTLLDGEAMMGGDKFKNRVSHAVNNS